MPSYKTFVRFTEPKKWIKNRKKNIIFVQGVINSEEINKISMILALFLLKIAK